MCHKFYNYKQISSGGLTGLTIYYVKWVYVRRMVKPANTLMYTYLANWFNWFKLLV